METRDEKIMKAAVNLYDNRLGHRPGNPCWHAPKNIWEELGKAIYGEQEQVDGIK